MPWKLTVPDRMTQSKLAPLQEQEFLILGPYLDLLDIDDVESFLGLVDHVGISLNEADDPLRRILQHYWLGGGRYDLHQAAQDLASFPPVAAYIESQHQREGVVLKLTIAQNATAPASLDGSRGGERANWFRCDD